MNYRVATCAAIVLSASFSPTMARAQKQDRTAATIAQALYEEAIAQYSSRLTGASCFMARGDSPG